MKESFLIQSYRPRHIGALLCLGSVLLILTGFTSEVHAVLPQSEPQQILSAIAQETTQNDADMQSHTHVAMSFGVLNGVAISKPQPPYPPIAHAQRPPQGTVVVQVVVDETGKVISAHATAGHPLLQQAAVQAANQARFAPTLISGHPIKITGLLTYDFVLPKQHKVRSHRRH